MLWLRRDEIMGNVMVVNNTRISLLFQFGEESFLNFYVTGHNGLPRIIKSKNYNKIIIKTTDQKQNKTGETIKETSRSVRTEWINNWPTYIVAR